MNIPVVLLVFIAAFILISLAAIWYMKWRIQNVIGEKFKTAETLVNYKRIPDAWKKDFQMSRKGVGSDLDQERSFYQEKITDLVHYFETSPYFPGEEDRRILLEELRKAKDSIHSMTI